MRDGGDGAGPGGGLDALRGLVERAQVHYRTVGDMVYAVLRQAILNGDLVPGERLRQDKLADALGVSRMPVREALLQLESESLVRFYPHRGAVVSSLSPEQVREVYTMRILLEGHALRQAIQRMTPERVRRLQELAAALDGEQEGQGLVDRRLAFYRELYEEDRNPLMVATIERLRNDVGRYWQQRRLVASEKKAHSRLVEYARRGDAEGAIEWLQAHLEQVCSELMALVGGREAGLTPAAAAPGRRQSGAAG